MTKWHKGRAAEWVTVTEPEYDVNERDSQFALQEYEEALCPQCNQLRSVCEDPATTWNPQIHACQAIAARTMYSREWQGRHEDIKPDADHWHPTDGAMIWATPDLPPDPDFVRQPPSPGLPPALQHALDDQE